MLVYNAAAFPSSSSSALFLWFLCRLQLRMSLVLSVFSRASHVATMKRNRCASEGEWSGDVDTAGSTSLRRPSKDGEERRKKKEDGVDVRAVPQMKTRRTERGKAYFGRGMRVCTVAHLMAAPSSEAQKTRVPCMHTARVRSHTPPCHSAEKHSSSFPLAANDDEVLCCLRKSRPEAPQPHSSTRRLHKVPARAPLQQERRKSDRKGCTDSRRPRLPLHPRHGSLC